MDEFIDTPDTELEVTEQLMVSSESALATLQSLHARVLASGAIDKTMANSIRTLTTGMESMDAHFSQHPVNSYTILTSSTNLKVTLENIVSTIAKKVWEAIKAIWKFIVDSIKSVLNVRQRNDEAFKKMQVDAAAQFKNNKVSPKPQQADGNEIPKKDFSDNEQENPKAASSRELLINQINNSSMALWLGTGAGKNSKIKTGFYGQELHDTECSMYEGFLKRLKVFKEYLKAPVHSPELFRSMEDDLPFTDEFKKLTGYTASFVNVAGRAVEEILTREAAEAANPNSSNKLSSMESINEWCNGIKIIRDRLTQHSISKDEAAEFDKEIKAVKDLIDKLIASGDYNGNENDIDIVRKQILSISNEIAYYPKIVTKYESMKARYYSGVALAFKGQVFDWSE